MLEKLIQELIDALNKNTAAHNGTVAAGASTKKETKPKADAKKGGKGKTAAGKGKGKKLTAADLKKKAKEIAMATDDPAACGNQIRALVEATADTCFNDANLKLDDFDDTALTLFKEALDGFEYAVEDDDPAEDDGMDI